MLLSPQNVQASTTLRARTRIALQCAGELEAAGFALSATAREWIAYRRRRTPPLVHDDSGVSGTDGNGGGDSGATQNAADANTDSAAVPARPSPVGNAQAATAPHDASLSLSSSSSLSSSLMDTSRVDSDAARLRLRKLASVAFGARHAAARTVDGGQSVFGRLLKASPREVRAELMRSLGVELGAYGRSGKREMKGEGRPWFMRNGATAPGPALLGVGGPP